MTIQTRPSGRTLADGLFDFLRRIELSGTYVDQIYVDSRGIPTAAYGYALLVTSGSTWALKPTLLADLQQIGITLSASDLNWLQQMTTNLNNSNGAANTALVQQLAASVGAIAEPDGRQLFDLEIGRASLTVRDRFRAVLNSNVNGDVLYNSLANSGIPPLLLTPS